MPVPTVTLILSGESLAVCRLDAGAEVPGWAWSSPFATVSRTEDELSIVCREEAVPEGVKAERGWRRLVVEGPLDFAITGILAAIAGPLAGAGVALFVVSTFDTDHVLVRAEALDTAIEALRGAGHAVLGALSPRATPGEEDFTPEDAKDAEKKI
jgi:hypothetical protein